MNRYKTYTEYKDSGVAWLGNIPQSWQLAPLKWFITRNDGGVWGNDPDGEADTIVLRSTEQTADGFWKLDDPAPRKLSIVDKEYALLIAGDLLVTKSSGSSLHIGKTTIVTDEIERLECCYSNFMQRVRTSELLLPKLAWYVMNNELARAQFDYLSNTTTGLANLNGTMIGQIVLAIPSHNEQKTIISFLDHETTKIDALIEKQQRLIELLKEKRQAVISRAVTKGLNADASMKDSGVEWLGEVPAHWEVMRLKHLALNIKAGPFGSAITKDMYVSAGYRVYGQEQVIPEDFSLGDYYISPETFLELSQYEVASGDILISCVGTFGKIAVVPPWIEPGIINPRLIRFRCNEYVTPSLLAIILRSAVVFEQFAYLSRGGTMDVINIGTLSEINVVVPPQDEQAELVEHVNCESARFDTLTKMAETATTLLKERRTALISAAVTGKIDLRNWQPSAT